MREVQGEKNTFKKETCAINSARHHEKKQRNELFYALSFFSQVSFTICACVMIGVLLGKFLDERFSTAPWLLLLFSFLGVAAAFKAIFNLSGKKKK